MPSSLIAWDLLLQQGVTGPTGPTGPAGAAGATGATGPTGPAGAGFSVAALQSADFNAAVGTHYPVAVGAGNVTATLPALSGVTAGAQISFAIVDGAANDLVLAGTGGDTVRRGADSGASVNVNTGIGLYSVLLIADKTRGEWTAQAEG